MNEDFNYQKYNPQIFYGIKSDVEEEMKLPTNDENAEKKSPVAKPINEMPLDDDDILKITSSQQKEELSDLNNLKITINSSVLNNIPVNYFLYQNLFNLDNILKACTKSQHLQSIRSITMLSSMRSFNQEIDKQSDYSKDLMPDKKGQITSNVKFRRILV